MDVNALDIIKIKGFLKQYIDMLKARGTQSDGYTVDVIEDLLQRI